MTNIKFQMTNIFKFLFVLGAVILFCGTAQAATFTSTGNPDDTASGEVITAPSSEATLDYQDINLNQKPTEHPASDIQVTVLPEYGFSAYGFPQPMGGDVFVGQTVTEYGYVTNEGNASDIYTFYYYCDFSGAGTGTWTVNIKDSGGTIATLTPGSPTASATKELAEDAAYNFYHEITAPVNGDAAAYIGVTSSLETDSTPVGQYTGANGLTYGGLPSWEAIRYYEIKKPVFTLYRETTVDAPVQQHQEVGGPEVGYSGDVHDCVPGSIITYMLDYSVTNDAAANVAIVDKVPANCNLAHFSMTGTTTNVVITAPSQHLNFVTIYYSTADNPDKVYKGGPTAEWTFVGTIEETGTEFPGSGITYKGYPTPDPQWNAKWVKWEKPNLSAGMVPPSPHITWGVTVR